MNGAVMGGGYVDRCDRNWKKYLFRREYYPGNNYYGIGEILRRYAGLPPWFPLNCKIQHGLKFFTHYDSPRDCPSHFAFYTSPEPRCLFLMHDARNADFFRKHGVGNVLPIGSPVVYLDDHLDELRRAHPEPRGTIAFPCKSSTGTDVNQDMEAFADMLLALPEKYQPVRVSMYYVDLNKGRDKPFRDRGMEVRCNGTLHNQDFLWNFFQNAADCEYAVSNDRLSSANYYCMYFGLKYFTYGPRPDGFIPSKPGDTQYGRERLENDHVSPYEFPMERCEDRARQQAIAAELLGLEKRLTRREMRRLLTSRLSLDFVARWLLALTFKRFRRPY